MTDVSVKQREGSRPGDNLPTPQLDGHAHGYAVRMTIQIAVKLSDEVVAAIDELVAAGRFDSRSAVVRAGLDLVTRQARSERINQAFADGFRRMPERPEELHDARRLALDAINDEPWEKWW